MAFGSRREDATWVIQTERRLDSGNAQALCDLLDAATESPGLSVVIDMEDLVYISSAGLRAILQGVRKLDFTQNPKRTMDVPALGRHHTWQVPEGFSLSAVTPDI